MKKDKFAQILMAAMAGNHEALEEILKLYDPMIHRYSCINGVPDEDLKQYIWMHIALNISKFPI